MMMGIKNGQNMRARWRMCLIAKEYDEKQADDPTRA
jgi:hypothetical protein